LDGGLTLLSVALVLTLAAFAAAIVVFSRKMSRAAALARQRTDQFAGALAHLRDGVAVFGSDQALLAWNERFFAVARLSATLAVAGTPYHLISEAVGAGAAIRRFDLPLGGRMMTAIEAIETAAAVAPAEANPPRANMLSAQGPASVKTGKRAVLVEDDAMVRLITADLLRELGYEVVEHATGGAALLSLAVDHADLLVTDIGLPDMSGLDVARHAVQLSPDIAIVVASGAHDDGEGGFVFLEKPYDVTRLRRAVERATQPVA
jgi:CheY-like chemotaxis protein